MSRPAPRKVVFTPDTILAALYDPRARQLLDQWRDGHVIPVVNRPLLLLYLKTLRQAGLSPALLRKWTLWFTSSARAHFVDDLESSPSSNSALCDSLATACKAEILRVTKADRRKK